MEIVGIFYYVRETHASSVDGMGFGEAILFDSFGESG
jgi:hypothetical protein